MFNKSTVIDIKRKGYPSFDDLEKLISFNFYDFKHHIGINEIIDLHNELYYIKDELLNDSFNNIEQFNIQLNKIIPELLIIINDNSVRDKKYYVKEYTKLLKIEKEKHKNYQKDEIVHEIYLEQIKREITS